MDRETWKGKNSIPSSSLLKMAFLKVGWLKAFEKLLSDADTAFSKLLLHLEDKIGMKNSAEFFQIIE